MACVRPYFGLSRSQPRISRALAQWQGWGRLLVLMGHGLYAEAARSRSEDIVAGDRETLQARVPHRKPGRHHTLWVGQCEWRA